jgi:hypothetical protein
MARPSDSRSAPALAFTAVLVALALVAPGEASAARPVPRAWYVDHSGEFWVGLRVASSGRQLGLVEAAVSGKPMTGFGGFWCSSFATDPPIRLSRPVRVGRRGGFRLILREESTVLPRSKLELSGRFVSKNRAVLRARLLGRQPRGRYCEGVPRAANFSAERLRRIPLRGCAGSQFKTVIATPTARIFWRWEPRREASGGSFGRGWDRIAYGCLLATDTPVRLAGDGYNVRDFHLAGFYSAHLQHACTPNSGECAADEIRVIDLRTGARVKVIRGWVTDLVLKESSSTAWIESTSSGKIVWAHDSLGKRKLDTGRQIAEESLTLDGSTLRWLKGGAVQTATLE